MHIMFDKTFIRFLYFWTRVLLKATIKKYNPEYGKTRRYHFQFMYFMTIIYCTLSQRKLSPKDISSNRITLNNTNSIFAILNYPNP